MSSPSTLMWRLRAGSVSNGKHSWAHARSEGAGHVDEPRQESDWIFADPLDPPDLFQESQSGDTQLVIHDELSGSLQYVQSLIQIWCSSVPPSNKAGGTLSHYITSCDSVTSVTILAKNTQRPEQVTQVPPNSSGMPPKGIKQQKPREKLLHWSLGEQFALSSLEDNGRCVILANSR